MKALSLYGCYADAVASGDKTVEYRTWRTHHRGDLLVCSAAWRPKDWNGWFLTGRAVCIASVADCVPFGPEHYELVWADDASEWPPGFAWVIEDVRIVDPVPVKGKQGLFTVEDALAVPTGQTYDDARMAWYEAGLITAP